MLIKGIKIPKHGKGVTIFIVKPNGETEVFGDRFLSLLEKNANVRGLRIGKTQAVSYGKETPMEITDIHVDIYRCPACGNAIPYYVEISDRYCPDCGQRIYQDREE